MRARIAPIAAALLLLGATLHAQDAIELVESIPREVDIDNTDIRNTREVWLEMIGRATRSIDIEQFYIANTMGGALGPVIDALRAATERGVSIRMLVEKSFSSKYPEVINEFRTRRNAAVRIIDFSRHSGRGIQHAKFFIVDDGDVFIGSQNFDWRAVSDIHEIGVRMRGRVTAGFYRDIFSADWAFAGGEPAPAPASTHVADVPVVAEGDTVLVTPVASPKAVLPDPASWDLDAIVRLMDGATREISLQALSYSPLEGRAYFDALETAMRRAAVRGVKVNLIVSDWSVGRNRIGYLKSLAAFPNIAVRISSIPDFSGGFISFARVEHCKYMVVDDAHVWIGTNNLSAEYFHHSRNVGVILRSARIAELMRRVFTRSWTAPFTTAVDCSKEYQPRRTDDGSGK